MQCLAVPCGAFLTKKHCLSLHQVIQNCIDEGRECRWVIGYVLVMGYANVMLEDLASVLQSDMYHNRYPGKGTTGTIYAQDANKSLVSCCALLCLPLSSCCALLFLPLPSC